MNILAIALLAVKALGHVNLPVDVQGGPGVQYSLACQSDSISGTLSGTAIQTDRRMICYAGAHDGEEMVSASFNDGMGSVACAPVPLSMFEPANHYRSPCRASFSFNTAARTCASQCVARPWTDNGSGGSSKRAMAFPNPLRVSRAEAMQFANLPAGKRVRIYSLTGRLVYEGTSGADGTLHWHLQDTGGANVGTGVYIVVAGGEKLKIAVQR